MVHIIYIVLSTIGRRTYNITMNNTLILRLSFTDEHQGRTPQDGNRVIC